jgi:nitrite reductase/ring-hydroxylating ferredoxin subunit
MSIRKLVAIGRIAALPEARPRLVTGPDGHRFVCIRRGERVDVLDDRCPHEGHPLSMGVLDGTVLTCQWHNWKFDVESGACRFGGESVRRYDADVVDGELFVELDEAPAAKRTRVARDLADAVMRESLDGIVRNGLRVAEITHSPRGGLEELARIVALRSPWGLRGAVVAIDAVARLESRGVVDRAEALAIAAVAVVHDAGGRAERPEVTAAPSRLEDAEGFLLDLVEERRAEAIARVAGLAVDAEYRAVHRAWFVPFVSMKLWDRGASLIRTAASSRVASWADRPVARALAVAHATALGWAVSESDLPPWRATRQALLEARTIEIGRRPLGTPEAFRDAVLASERDAVAAVLDRLRDGVDPTALLFAIRDAALERLARYDTRHSRRTGVDVTAIEPARALVFAHEALALGDTPFRAAHAVLAAGLVGKLARFDRTTRDATSAPAAGFDDDLTAAVQDAIEHRVERIADDEWDIELRSLIRTALLESRAPASFADLTALAAAVCDVSEAASLETRRLAWHAFANAAIADAPDRLDRLAANAARFVRDGTPPEML